MADTLFTDATATVNGTLVVSAWLNDVDRNTYNILASVVGTNTITATGPLPMLAYQRGIRLWFTPVNNNTGATTLNVNGLGAKNVTKFGTQPLVAGDLVSGVAALIFYDGVQFQVINPQSININAVGRLIGTQTFPSTAVYTPTAGTNSIVINMVGGGGGGGGTPATAAGQVAIGAGGGAGGYVEHRLTSGFSGVTVTIGGAGTAGSGSNGGAGGASSFGAITASGGFGAAAGTAGATSSSSGGGGGTGSGGNILNIQGMAGGSGVATFAAGYVNGTVGGSGWLGNAGINLICGLGNSFPGSAATGRGAGGGGGVAGASQGATSGGAGGAGLAVIYEYS